MHAETLAIGSELLLGEVIDTNSSAIAKRLRSIGLPLRHSSAVGDDLAGIVAAIRHGLARSDVVIITGGLGPTVDDLTREAAAQATGMPLVFDANLLAQIEDRFRRLGQAMADNNRRQAFRPQGAIPIENRVGTAPAFIVEQDGHAIICLPGVPREMEWLMDQAVLPWLRQRFNLQGVIKSRAVKLSGIGESAVDREVGDWEKLVNPAVGLNAYPGLVVIRITATADSEDEADRLIAPVEASVRERLGQHVFGADSDTLEGVVLAALRLCGETVATIEAGTGGRLAGKLADADPAGGVFAGGTVVGQADADDPVRLARQAARAAGAAWGLACAMERDGGQIGLVMGLWHEARQEQWRRGFAGHAALAPEWAANLALNALRLAINPPASNLPA